MKKDFIRFIGHLVLLVVKASAWLGLPWSSRNGLLERADLSLQPDWITATLVLR